MAKTKINITSLKSTLATNFANKVAYKFNPTVSDFTNLIEKVSDIVEYDDHQKAYLTELDGQAGAGITEEMFMNLPDVATYADTDTGRSTEAGGETTPKFLTPEACYYSYPLKPLKIKVSEPINSFKAYVNDPAQEAAVISKIISKGVDSKVLARNFEKKQLLGQFINHVQNGDTIDGVLVGGRAECKKDLKKPGATAASLEKDGEDFIKAIKQLVKEAKWENTRNCLGVVQGAAPELILYINGAAIGASLSVDVLAGAFNPDELGIGIKVVEVPDFGSYSGKAYALLTDSRSMKLSTNYEETLSHVNADAAVVDTVFHWSDKAFYSNCTYAVVIYDSTLA